MHLTKRNLGAQNSRMESSSGKFFTSLAAYVTGEFASTWIWPAAITAGGVVIGWVQQFPLFHLYVGGVFLFAASSTGLLRFSEWRYRNSVYDKLHFNKGRVSQVVNEKGHAVALLLGVEVRSSALFPISFSVDKIITEFHGKYPPKKDSKQQIHVIPPNGIGWFDDAAIAIPLTDYGSYEGKVGCTLKYGRSGALNNKLKADKKVMVNFNEHGSLDKSHPWVDA